MGTQGQDSPVAIVLDRLDTIIELLKMSLGTAPSNGLATLFPELQQLFGAGLTPGRLTRSSNVLLEHLLAAALPSAPQNVRTITVGTAEELLQNNESQPLMRVDVTNLNVAQPLIVSKRGVTAVSGIQVLARQTMPFVLPQGSQLFGIVALATIQVTVSEGYNIQPMLSTIFRQGS